MRHHLTVAPWNYIYVSDGRKHFIVIPDTTPPLNYGDVVVLALRGHPEQAPIVRWVRYIENGVGYAPGYVGVELVETEPEAQATRDDCHAPSSIWTGILDYICALSRRG